MPRRNTLADNPLVRDWSNKQLEQMKARELELSEKEWFGMQFLESQLAGVPMNPIAPEFMDFLDTVAEKKLDWESRKQAKKNGSECSG